MSKILELSKYRAKFDLTTLYVGDWIEWKDYDNKIYTNQIAKITFTPYGGGGKEWVQKSTPMRMKEDLSFHLEGGMILIGSVIQRKVIKSKEMWKPGSKNESQIKKDFK